MSLPVTLGLIGGLGTSEVLFILLIIMLLFGASKIPELARSLGKAQREFQQARDEIDREVNKPAKTATSGGVTTAPSYSPPEDSDDARVLREAQELGIPTDGKTIEQLRGEIQQRRDAQPPKE